ncbi:hypothetical protein HYH02_010038 [Chlamydomonas schloesseri]|uniref:Uncharacterized protein n=1 Tax=Chlamydomonas schloesseri TaxID=2026947 RepID=A0A835W8D9_9CHLO|nr:hypothetical protein HYH02_010038 [Chlamydomonas schloesseri]|eukprot:KAG2441194.1 hypothetical protein HYH02_010038 [Chlamydomonas schloesseri]
MVRPKSSNKAPKQKAGAAQGKRKHGGGPRGGAPGGRPAKQSRREGRSKPLDNDIFEAEDSDPDEVKNAKRFDEVENYEYELPSDFEDEEIDEEMAFTEEDKKKFGAWFEKEVDADEDDDGEDGGTLGVGDDDGDYWDGDDEDDEDEDADEEEDDDDVEAEPARGAKGNRKRTAREREQEEEADEDTGGGDDDDDLFLDGDSEEEEEDEDEDGLGGEDDADEEDEERHLAMLRDVLEGGGKGGRAGGKRARDPNAAVLSEAYPESEYGLNPGAASSGGLGGLSIADLLAGLTGEERRKLGASRRLLEKVAGAAGEGDGEAGGKRKSKKGGADKADGSSLRPVSVPLPSILADRQERKAGYEAAAEDVTKWTSIVKANREAPTLRLVAGRDEVPRVNTTAALVAQHTPSADNALEAEVAALLEAAGAAHSEALEEAEEKLALKALSLEEARERRERLAKLRSLLFYHELKSRRLKAIKSKEYHRHLAKAAKRKATKLAAAAAEGAAAGDGDAEAAAARAAAIEAEFQRAKERLTQRHRNTSRWARRALKRGQLEVDPGTKAALAEQILLGQQLKRKIEGRRGSGSEDEGDSDASTSASDGEGGEGAGGGGGGAKAGGRVRSAALELLAGGGPAGGEDAPKKGLLALPFMKRALERRRLAAAAEAEELLRELDEQAAAGGSGAGGFGGEDGDGAKGAGGDALERLVGYGVPAAAANGTAGRRRFGGGAAAAAAAEADGDDEADLGSDLDSDDAEDAEAKAERLGRKTKEAAAADAASRKQQQKAAAAAAKKAKRGGGSGAAPPTAEEQADLDAALAAGAAGRGLLVSSEADLLVVDGGDADADQERRRSGGAASTRGGGSGGVLAEVAAQRGSVSAGRAGLFQGKTNGAAAAAAAAVNGSGAASGGDDGAAKFVASKKFVGARPGYAFKKGPQGIGYYLDPKQPLAAALTQPAAAAGGIKGGKGAAAAAAAAAAPVSVAGQAKPAQQSQQQQAGKGKHQQQQAGKAGGKPGAKGAADGTGASDGDDDDDDEAAPLMKAAPSNKDLIRQAFAGDDVAAEFTAEKAAAVAEELPDIQEPSALPGWGAWSSQQRNPKWMQAAKDRAAKQRAEAAAGRRDAGMKYVVVSEKWDKKAAKYTAPAAPFPFTSPEAYERSLRQPLGREFNPDQAFRDLTRPAVIKQAGVTINPLRFSEATAKTLGHKGRAAEAQRESKKVVTVAGGMPRVGKGQVAK